ATPPETARPAGQEELFLPDPLQRVPEMDLGILREEEAPDTSPPPDPEAKRQMIREGRALFFSGTAFNQRPSEGPQVLGQILSCASCHLGPGFVDGRSHLIGPTDDRELVLRQTPHLFGMKTTAPFGWDGRVPSLENQARGAITSDLEMNSGREPTVRELAALAAFVESIEPPPAVPGRDFDPELAKFGKEVFKDERGTDPSGEFSPNVKLSCETCHLESNNFTDNKPHRIALPFPFTGDPVFDPGQVDGEGKIRGFDTPPLIGIRFTAPYFHDGLAGDPTAPTNVLTRNEPARRALRDNLIPFYSVRFAFNFTPSEMDALTEFLLSL
ncbi:MAG: hypothetical protein M3357_18760, partial [Actinomycetota bacterium]|nr:hypothetical protein [Actinomycetota bacterium]